MSRFTNKLGWLTFGLLLFIPAAGRQAQAIPAANGITMVSKSTSGAVANAPSNFPDLSGQGNYIVFESEAANLIAGDTNGLTDIFLHDRLNGTTKRISEPFGGGDPNGTSRKPSISENGIYIAFASEADNLVADDTNELTDVFVANRSTGIIHRVSIATDGSQGNSFSDNPAISASGRFIVFMSTATNFTSPATQSQFSIFLHDRNPDNDVVWDEPGQTLTRIVSIDSSGVPGNGFSGLFGRLAVSDDGMTIAFTSDATNLVSGDTNGRNDVFVHRRDPDNNSIPDEPGRIETVRVSVSSSGIEGNLDSFDPQISSDGDYISFTSAATNLVSGDTNGRDDVFVHRLSTGITRRVSVSSNGGQNSGSSGWQDIDAAGRYVTFQANNSTLVNPTCAAVLDCIYRHNLQTGQTELITRQPGGSPGQGHSYGAALSPGGEQIAFISEDPGLVSGDTNGLADIYIFDQNTLPRPLSAFINIPTRQLPSGQHVLPWGRSSNITLPIQLGQPYTLTTTLDIAIIDSFGQSTNQSMVFPAGSIAGTLTITNPQPQTTTAWLVTLENGAAPAGEPTSIAVSVVPEGVIGPAIRCPVCMVAILMWEVGLDDLPAGCLQFGIGADQNAAGHWSDTLTALRDDLMATTPAGRYYRGLYNAYGGEIAQLILFDPQLMWSAWEGMLAWAPPLQALVDGSGSSVVITPALVDHIDMVLAQIEPNASPGLQALIQRERVALDLPSFEGVTMAEGWTKVNQRPVSTIHLPLISTP